MITKKKTKELNIHLYRGKMKMKGEPLKINDDYKKTKELDWSEISKLIQNWSNESEAFLIDTQIGQLASLFSSLLLKQREQILKELKMNESDFIPNKGIDYDLTKELNDSQTLVKLGYDYAVSIINQKITNLLNKKDE